MKSTKNEEIVDDDDDESDKHIEARDLKDTRA